MQKNRRQGLAVKGKLPSIARGISSSVTPRVLRQLCFSVTVAVERMLLVQLRESNTSLEARMRRLEEQNAEITTLLHECLQDHGEGPQLRKKKKRSTYEFPKPAESLQDLDNLEKNLKEDEEYAELYVSVDSNRS